MPVYYCPKCRGYIYMQDGKCPIDGFDLAEFYKEDIKEAEAQAWESFTKDVAQAREAEG